jgi:ketosteroid isomerase-like protein
MSEENASAPRRDPFEWLGVRLPMLADSSIAATARLRHDSPLRMRLVQWRTKRQFKAVNRGDADVVVLLYEPHAEVLTTGMDLLGIRHSYQGPQGIRDYIEEFNDVFSEWSWTLRALVDAGDRLAIQFDLVGRGRTSGAETRVIGAGIAVHRSTRGKIDWQHFFVKSDGWSDALEAAGLSE